MSHLWAALAVMGLFPLTGPFVELDGTRSPPSFFVAYVATVPLLLGIIVPTAGFGYLVWQNNTYLAASTLGLYLLEVVAQLVSEGVFLKTSKLLSVICSAGPSRTCFTSMYAAIKRILRLRQTVDTDGPIACISLVPTAVLLL